MKTNLLRTDGARVAMALAFLVSLLAPIRAQEVGVAPEEAGVAPISGMQIEPQGARRKAPAGLLPVPDYAASIWKREQLTGDWWGARTYLANKGVQIGVELNQYVQGVTNGGRERVAEYGGTADYTVNLDLMRIAGRAHQIPRRIALRQLRQRPGWPDPASQHRRFVSAH
jgi:hypothetical protein